MADLSPAAKQAFFASMDAQKPYREKCIATVRAFWEAEKEAATALQQRNAALLKAVGEQVRRLAGDAKAAEALHGPAAQAIAVAMALPEVMAAHGKSLEGWREQLALLERENTKLVAKAATLLKKVANVRKELADARDEAQRLLGDAEVLLDADAGRASEAHEALQRAYDGALVAQRGRDAAALRAAKKAGAEVPLRACQEALRAIDAELARIQAEVLDGKKLGAGTLAPAKSAWKKLCVRRDAMRAALDACPPLLQRLNALAPDAVDVRRAATHLELERDAHADLERALQGDEAQMLKNLDALSKKRKLAHSGRELLGRLRKAQVL
jgi:hypothetical protein